MRRGVAFAAHHSKVPEGRVARDHAAGHYVARFVVEARVDGNVHRYLCCFRRYPEAGLKRRNAHLARDASDGTIFARHGFFVVCPCTLVADLAALGTTVASYVSGGAGYTVDRAADTKHSRAAIKACRGSLRQICVLALFAHCATLGALVAGNVPGGAGAARGRAAIAKKSFYTIEARSCRRGCGICVLAFRASFAVHISRNIRVCAGLAFFANNSARRPGAHASGTVGS